MNLVDMFEPDEGGLNGFQAMPEDHENLLKEVEFCENLINNQLKTPEVAIDFSMYKDKIKHSLMQKFTLFNETKLPELLNGNDAMFRVFITMTYLDSCFNTKDLSIANNNDNTWGVLVNACCSLADIASFRYMHLLDSSRSPAPYLSEKQLIYRLKNDKIGFVISLLYKNINRVYHEDIQEELPIYLIRQQLQPQITAHDQEETRKRERVLKVKFAEPSEHWIKIREIATHKSEEQQFGYLWKSTPESYVERFPILCTHVISELLYEHWLLDQFPINVNVLKPIPSAVYDKCHNFMLRFFRYEIQGAFFAILHKSVFEHHMPLGARSYTVRISRSGETRGLLETPEIVFQKAIGTTATKYLVSLMDTENKIIEIGKNKKHPLYPFVFLAVFHFHMLQSSSAATNRQFFYRDRVFANSRFLADKRVIRHLNITNDKTIPVIMCVTNVWHVYHRRQWLPCSGLIEAILQWATIVIKDFDGFLIDRFQIKAVVEPFGIQ
jgi:hypothetical protein